MPQRRHALVAAIAVTLLTAALLAVRVGGDGAPGEAPGGAREDAGRPAGSAAQPSGAVTPGAVTPGAAGGSPGPGATGSPGDGPGDGEGDGAGDGPGEEPGGEQGGEQGLGGIEVLPDQPTASGLPGLGAAPPPADQPLVTGPLPRGASARDEVVAGFPSRVVPVAPRSRVAASSVSSSDERLQAALTASQGDGVDDVLLFYRVRLGRWGFSEVPAQAVSGSRAAAFRRGGDTVVVTATPREAGADYSVLATLRVGS